MKAIWNDEIIAETKQTLVVEGRHYFPQDTVKLEYLSSNDYCEECSWKGLAKYSDCYLSKNLTDISAEVTTVLAGKGSEPSDLPVSNFWFNHQ